jgi:outer membrane protein assembly factor BamB
MGSAAVLFILFSIWWWRQRGISLSRRFLGFGLLLGLGVLAGACSHSSMRFAAATFGVPLVLTTWTLWMALTRAVNLPWKTTGAIAVVMLTWALLPLLRMDGADAELHADIRWRWQPTSEDRFLARNRSMPHPLNAGTELDAGPGDWTGFRGSQRAGAVHGTNIATDWSKTPPKLLWRQPVGPAWSSVAVAGDLLFTQEQRGKQETVVCYKAETGEEVWVHEDTARFEEGVSGAGPRATPTFSKGRLYTQGATGLLNCLDAATGKVYWSRDLTRDAGAKPPRWGYSSSPLVVDHLVIAYAGGSNQKSLLAYHSDTGEIAWAAPAGADSYSSPQLTTIYGQPQCLMLTDHGLFALDPATGAILWQHGLAMPGAPRTAQASQVGQGDLIVPGLQGTGIAKIHLSQEGKTWNVAEVWQSEQMNPEFPDIVMHQGHIYGFDVATFSCVDAATGKGRWRKGYYGRGEALLLADQSLMLVVTEKTGEVILLSADPERSQELGRFKAVKGKTWNHPVVAHGRLYVRNAEEMACYELAGK